MRMHNNVFTVSTHLWEGERDWDTKAFLGGDFLRWGRALDGTSTLMVWRDPSDHGSDFLVVRPGWTLVRWDDGGLSAHSPISVSRQFRPDAEDAEDAKEKEEKR